MRRKSGVRPTDLIKNSSFYLAMRLLPPDRRAALFAVYGFCRKADDIADGDAGNDEKRRALEEMEGVVRALFQGSLAPEWLELAEAIQRHALRQDDFIAVLEGCGMDAKGAMLRPELQTLDLYCDRVASAAGRLAVRVFGMEGEEGIVLAHHLGRAMQLTNIMRDIDEDAAMGRLYLPFEILSRYGAETVDPGRISACSAFSDIMAEMEGMARGHYEAAAAALKSCPKGTRRPAQTMLAIYRALLDRLARAGWRPAKPLRLSRLDRAYYLIRYGLREFD